MKIDPKLLTTIPETLTEKTDGTPPAPGSVVEDPQQEPVQVRHPLPKGTDSVEMKLNSFYNFDNAAKLDPSKTNLESGKEVPAALMPGVPFREKVELPKNLPNGEAINSGVGSGDLGLGKTRTGPNHMGIDMKGTEIKNQLDEALKLKEGSNAQSTPPQGGTVNFNHLGGSGRKDTTYHAGLNPRPGMDRISADKDGKGLLDKAKGVADKVIDYLKDISIEKFGPPGAGEAMNILDMPGKTGEITGDPKDHVRGIAGAVYPEARLNRIYDQGENKYVNPDSPEANQPPPVTDESLRRVQLRNDINKRTSNEDLSQGTIDASKLSTTDPRRKLISNPNPESETTVGTGESIGIIHDAKGPDTINPNDPVLGDSTGPIVIDPNRPK